MNSPYSRGSEWGRWDLHFHTPSSYDYDNKSITDEDIIANLKEAGIKVVAITDHHFIDISRIKNLKKLAGDDIVFFVGIEFCSDARGSDPIHFIGIFSEDCDAEYIWSEINSKTDIAKKKQEGKKDNEIYCDLEKTSKLIKSLKGIISVHAGSKSNSIEKITNSLPSKMAEKEDITKWIDIFELGKEKDQEGYIKSVFPKIGVHPMVICSDNHNAKKYKLKQSCWIKANPTFEGLRQIIYEPQDRVKIQELEPEEKSDYTIIDRVEYKNASGEKQVAYFNKNLNSIIGSRATGKSNLLKNIAFSIDPEQCRAKSIELKDFLQLKDFKVFWKDTKENTLILKENKEKGLLFIPQRYLGELVYEKSTQFDDFLSNLFENKEDFSLAIQNYRKFENENALGITSLIRELLVVRENGKEKQNKIKKLGEKKDIESEIKKIDLKLGEINKTGKKITSKDLEDYKRFTAEKSKQKDNLKIIDRDMASLKLLKGEEVITTEKIFEFEFSQKYREKIEKRLKESDELFKKEFVDQEINNLKKDKEKLELTLSNIETNLKPLRAKVEKHQALVELTKSLQDKKESLQLITTIQKELEELRKIYSDKQGEIIEKYILFNEQYKNLSIDIGALEFSTVEITTSFAGDLLRSFSDENINYHYSTFLRTEDGKKIYKDANDFLNTPEQWSYDKNKFPRLLKQLLSGILSGSLLLKSGREEESVLIELFKNRFKVDFLKSIKNKRGDEFEDMSDGEKSLALLEFIFKFDDYNYPVLIDQPEDDLDAKAISKHIVDFIKKEKIKRQIIVASHNANLVVCGDSDEVIVSNKHGGRNPNFKYLSGAIENPIIKDEIIEVLEGGKKALAKRRDKLGLSL